MDAIAAIRSRRSVRAFRAAAPDHAVVEALIADAAHAPFTPIAKTGAWRFTVILGRERLEDYGERALAFARAHRPQLAGYEWTERPGFSVFHGAPAAIVISGREALPVALEECTRAGQLLDIAATARGLGVCWIGSPMLWLRDPATRAELSIPEGWLPYAAFALGEPDVAADAPRAERPPLEIDWIGG
jgi:nitroreductase